LLNKITRKVNLIRKRTLNKKPNIDNLTE